MENKTLHYQLSPQVVDYLLNAINKVQIVGVQAATDLLEVTKLLQNPSNKDDLQKEQYEQLK
jgi:hypothetical protein